MPTLANLPSAGQRPKITSVLANKVLTLAAKQLNNVINIRLGCLISVTRFQVSEIIGQTEKTTRINATNADDTYVNHTVSVPDSEPGSYIKYRIRAITAADTKSAASNIVSIRIPLAVASASSAALMWGLIGGGIALLVIILVIVLICYLCPERCDKVKQRKRDTQQWVQKSLKKDKKKEKQPKKSKATPAVRPDEWRSPTINARQFDEGQKEEVDYQGATFFGQEDLDHMSGVHEEEER